MDFRLLGRVEVLVNSQKIDLGPAESPRVRCILAVLLRTPGEWVTTDAVVSRVWGEKPPGAAVRYKYIGWLRGALAPFGVALVQRDDGYLLDVRPHQVDLHRFRRLMSDARQARGSARDASALLRQALALWKGPPLAGLTGPWVQLFRDQLERERRDAIILCARTELVFGRPAEIAAELAEWEAEYPADEGITGVRMLALHRDGQRQLALDCYERAERYIRATMDAQPGPELRTLYRQVQARDPVRPGGQGDPPPLGRVPRQLPAVTRYFIGRDEELETLTGLLENVGHSMVISVISGTAGVGKTALAALWAHQVADRFRDGQLYVNLRGFGPSSEPLAPAEALHGFLVGLGVLAGQVPASLEARCALYRSLLAGKRMLVLLDNARDAAQVRPLLPGAPGCLVVVTSRDRLVSLIAAEGASSSNLNLLSATEAEELLVRRLRERTAREPAATDELIALSARLPLALNIIAARAETSPSLTLAALSNGLRSTRAQLDAFTAGDEAIDVRAVLSWSRRQLSPPAARMFRPLGVHPGPDISAPATASLVGIPLTQAGDALAELIQAHLLTELTPGRYSFHDLLRAHASELASEEERRDATGRTLNHYLSVGHAAAITLNPARVSLVGSLPSPEQMPERICDRAQAEAWYEAEFAVLLAVIALAVEASADRHAWQLPWVLADFCQQRGHWREWTETQQIALDAARRLADPDGQARAHHYLGYAQARLGSYREAHRHFDDALWLFGERGDKANQAHVHLTIAIAMEAQDRLDDGLTHARRALSLYQSANHRAGQANALNSVGWYLSLAGMHEQAVPYCQRAVGLHQELGNRDGEAATWDSLGHVQQHLGNHARAIECYLRAVQLRPGSGDRYNKGGTLTRLGETYQAAGNPKASRSAWEQALAIFDDMRHPDADGVRTLLGQLDSSLCPCSRDLQDDGTKDVGECDKSPAARVRSAWIVG